jgi:hypothetical protein
MIRGTMRQAHTERDLVFQGHRFISNLMRMPEGISTLMATLRR